MDRSSALPPTKLAYLMPCSYGRTGNTAFAYRECKHSLTHTCLTTRKTRHRRATHKRHRAVDMHVSMLAAYRMRNLTSSANCTKRRSRPQLLTTRALSSACTHKTHTVRAMRHMFLYQRGLLATHAPLVQPLSTTRTMRRDRRAQADRYTQGMHTECYVPGSLSTIVFSSSSILAPCSAPPFFSRRRSRACCSACSCTHMRASAHTRVCTSTALCAGLDGWRTPCSHTSSCLDSCLYEAESASHVDRMCSKCQCVHVHL